MMIKAKNKINETGCVPFLPTLEKFTVENYREDNEQCFNIRILAKLQANLDQKGLCKNRVMKG